MGIHFTSANTLGLARVNEKSDCRLYSSCLHEAARGKTQRRFHSGGAPAVPCKGCKMYKPEEAKRPTGWEQPRGFIPSGRF